ncbi:hypothetical protein C8R43DRAFT_1115538 [Mycena crocata]|nr:hypothetical protein C8R43DRAFT_1115538 [Mycena crocata]
MSYYHASPPSPTSSASSFSSGPPQTPTSPNYQTSLVIPSLPQYTDGYADKPRQNTAERRASHNAVERARRETLNARFLDLAALLPNLKHLRRPSKSAIVNSSIAHVRAARRYRLLAAQQLRALNAECDMVRREVNQWRARAGVRLAEAPLRSDGFTQILGGEEPAFDPADLDGEDDEWDVPTMGAPPARRRAQPPREPACEGPLLLSHPYASSTDVSPPPPARHDTPHALSPPHSHVVSPPQSHVVSASPPYPHPTSPVAVSFETPNPYDGFLMQQQQGDVWGYAPQGQPGW